MRFFDTASRRATPAAGRSPRLTPLRDTGHNPGALEAFTHVPTHRSARAPLVVALHGCTQTAAAYDHGTGWSTLAERAGFAVLLPQQTRANNANTCFNWFEAADIARSGGEAESIALMVDEMVEQHGLDPARVFVTGLSAGGAMAAVMLAAHPERFAGGAVIGGLPYGTAQGVGQALERMRGAGHADDATAVASVRGAGGGSDRWPRLSIWHGTADATVAHGNMTALGRQWRGLFDLNAQPSSVESGSNWEHSAWLGPDGQVAVEEWSVAGMGHGVPIDPSGPDGLGATGPYMLDVGLSSTRLIAESWGLVEPGVGEPARDHSLADAKPTAPDFVRDTIERALRSAHLLP